MKRIAINVLLMILAFTIQNCIFPLLPFLSAAPNLLLILTFSFGFIHGKEAGMYYGCLPAFCWICFTAALLVFIPCCLSGSGI